jgi:hypothetical protein
VAGQASLILADRKGLVPTVTAPTLYATWTAARIAQQPAIIPVAVAHYLDSRSARSKHAPHSSLGFVGSTSPPQIAQLRSKS